MLKRQSLRVISLTSCTRHDYLGFRLACRTIHINPHLRHKTIENTLRQFSSTPSVHVERQKAQPKDERKPLDTDKLIVQYGRAVQRVEKYITLLQDSPLDALHNLKTSAHGTRLKELAEIVPLEKNGAIIKFNDSKNVPHCSRLILKHMSASISSLAAPDEIRVLWTPEKRTSIEKAALLIKIRRRVEDAKVQMAQLRGDAIRWNRRTVISHVAGVKLERIVHAEWKRHDSWLRRIHEQAKRDFA